MRFSWERPPPWDLLPVTWALNFLSVFGALSTVNCFLVLLVTSSVQHPFPVNSCIKTHGVLLCCLTVRVLREPCMKYYEFPFMEISFSGVRAGSRGLDFSLQIEARWRKPRAEDQPSCKSSPSQTALTSCCQSRKTVSTISSLDILCSHWWTRSDNPVSH